MSHTRAKQTLHFLVIAAVILNISQCARLGEASVTLSEQNMLPAQQVEAGITKPGMGSAGGPSTWSFWVKNRQAASDAMLGSFTPFYKVSAIRLAVSAHFVFYRDVLDSGINSAQASTVLTTMENAYDNLKSVYGGGEHPYTNDGARIVILAYNIQDDYSTTGNYVGGFFSPRDLFSNTFTTALFTDPVATQQYSNLIGLLGGYSNEMSLINYDLNPGYSLNPAQVNDIVIHELSHLFTYSKRVMKQRLTNHDLWIAEGIAENAPDQTQGILPANTHAVQQLRLTQLGSPSTIDYYQDAPQLTDFLTWAPKIVGYLQSNLFFNYLRNRAEVTAPGSSATMLSELMITSDQTVNGFETIAKKYTSTSGFAEFYGDFVMTHYLMMLGYASNNINAPTVNGVTVNDKYSMNLVKIGDSKAAIGASYLSKYSTNIPFNFEGPKCADGSIGLKPNSYIIIRHRYPSTTVSPFNGDIDTVNTAGPGAISGELPLKYVVNLRTENTLISGSPPANVALATFDAGQTLPLTTYGWGGNDTAHIIIYNPNKSGSCRPFDPALILKRNHSKWVGSQTCPTYNYSTNASPDFDWQSDTGACWANNQDGRFNRPSGIAAFAGGTPPSGPYSTSNFLYVADYNNMSLQRLDLDKGTAMGRLGGTSTTCPTTGSLWDNNPSRYVNGYCEHDFDVPQDVYVDSAHKIYVADSNNRRIVKYDAAGNFAGWIGLNGTCTAGAWQSPGSGTVTDAETLRLAGGEFDPCMFWVPWGITSDGTDLYITDIGKHRIFRRNKTTGNYVAYLGNGQTAWNNTTTGPLPGSAGFNAGYFNSPRGIVATGGNLYVTDEQNHRVVRISISSGNFTGWIGDGLNGWQSTWATSATASSAVRFFKNPSAIATDGTYLYIADRLNNRIVRWNIGTGIFAGWLGHGKVAWEMTAAAPTSDPYAGVTYYPPDYYAEPQGLAFVSAASKGTKRNYLFMTSVYNGRVTRINLDCASAPTSAACDQLYDPLTP